MFAQDSWKASPTFTISYGLGYSDRHAAPEPPVRWHRSWLLHPGVQSKVFPGHRRTSLILAILVAIMPAARPRGTPSLDLVSALPGHRISASSLAAATGSSLSVQDSAFTITAQKKRPRSKHLARHPSASLPSALGTTVRGRSLPTPTRISTWLVGRINQEQVSLRSSYGWPGRTFRNSIRSTSADGAQVSVLLTLRTSRSLSSARCRPKSWRASYVGTLGRHNQNVYEGIPITQAGHDACLADPACFTDPDNQASAIRYHTHGIWTRLRRHGRAGLVSSGARRATIRFRSACRRASRMVFIFQVSYTYSHALDSASSFENSGFGSNGSVATTSYDTSATAETRCSTLVNGSFLLPFTSSLQEGWHWYSPLNLLVSGWQVSGIMTFATGFPFDISYAGATSLSLWCSATFTSTPARMHQIRSLLSRGILVNSSQSRLEHQPIGLHGSSIQQRVPASAEATGTFGNTHRNPYHGPGINNTNMILAKNFSVRRCSQTPAPYGKRQRLQSHTIPQPHQHVG